MKLTQGELLGWAAVAEVLHREEPAELELLPDVVEASGEDAQPIGKRPGAFDINTVPLLAHSLFQVVCAGLQAALPKLFDAAVDVSKDELKRRLAQRQIAPMADSKSVRAAEIRIAMAKAAVSHRLSDRTATLLADSLIARLAEKSLL